LVAFCHDVIPIKLGMYIPKIFNKKQCTSKDYYGTRIIGGPGRHTISVGQRALDTDFLTDLLKRFGSGARSP
jgi:hypothetical protein